MRGDTRFYSSDGRTVFCGHCDRKDCGNHYKNKEKYPWRYYKGHGTMGLKGYDGCCNYESPSETKKMVKKHLKITKINKKIKTFEDCIEILRDDIEKINYPWKYK